MRGEVSVCLQVYAKINDEVLTGRVTFPFLLINGDSFPYLLKLRLDELRQIIQRDDSRSEVRDTPVRLWVCGHGLIHL